jgi:hypothetical protein
MDIQKYWRPIETAQRFSVAHPKSLQPTLAVTLRVTTGPLSTQQMNDTIYTGPISNIRSEGITKITVSLLYIIILYIIYLL